mgnify:CR=1 FL=1
MINKAQNERDRRQMSPYAKVGRIAGQTLRGWLRHAMEKLLISNGVSVCHPLSRISATSDRNKDYFKEDIKQGYHSRGECAENGGCLIYQLFGDLDVPGNLIVPSAYFYPTTSGNGAATTEINKIFGTIGGGRVEITHCSPRARAHTHQTYMAMDMIVGVMIKAPVNLVLIQANRTHEVVLLKTLEFLKSMNQEYEYSYLLGGMRTAGYGRAALLPLKPKEKKTRQKSLIADDEEVGEPVEGHRTYRIQFKLTKREGEKLDREFLAIIAKEKEKFPIAQEITNVEETAEATL